MLPVPLPPSLFAAAVQQRITSALVDSFTAWWQLPALVVVLAALAGFILWTYRRDAAELPRGVGVLLAALRLGAVAALAAAYLDLERTTEHEIVSPSRVALLVDSSASMTLADVPADAAAAGAGEPPTRGRQVEELLIAGGLLAALEPRHEVSVWRFDADAEGVAVRPVAAATEDETHDEADDAWRKALAPRGFETRLGEALVRVLEEEPSGVLAGVVVLSDGANNAGVDPAAAAAGLGKAGVPVYPIGIGSDRLPANVRVADLLAPARCFPGDRFTVTGYVQAQELAGQLVKVELAELAADEAAAPAREPGNTGRRGRLIDTAEVRLAADGELVAVRFDVPGLQATGRRSLVMRVVPPAADRTPADNASLAEIEVVDRVTQVLLLASGPTREYQFMRNVLDRDKSFAVDVVLATASEGVSQDARRILASFPESAEELDAYDVVVAFDYDWRQLDAAAHERLERWVARESGGLVLVAGGIFMDAWLADPRSTTIRNLHPVELRRSPRMVVDEPAGSTEPMPLSFTRDGQDAEFLWLSSSRVASQTVWSEFPGVYACFDATVAKPGATVFTRAKRRTSPAADEPIHMAGQFYGSGSVFYIGTGEMWRLRAIDQAVHERLTTQLMRHVSQGRLLRGSRRARLLVDRDRFAVGSGVAVRVVGPDGESSPAGAACSATAPDGDVVRVPLAVDPSRPGAVQGVFVAAREGSWLIEVDLGGGERLSRRIQARLPDRELERPRLERGLLEQVATLSGGTPRFLADAAWSPADAQALAAKLVDRSRRDYETGAPDAEFKRLLHALLLGLGVGLLCCEWIIRRLVRLA